MTPILIAARGLPGSGKSTWAQALVAERGEEYWAIVNRDLLRRMAHNGVHIQQTVERPGTERMIRALRDASIKELLSRRINVVCDDTNLRSRDIRELRQLADLCGADFEIHDISNVDPEECMRRNAERGLTVPQTVIAEMYTKFVKGKGWPLPVPERRLAVGVMADPYVPSVGKPGAVIVDIDGTVANMGTRDPFNEAMVHLDEPILPTIECVLALETVGYKLIFVSGRSEKVRDATEAWLRDYLYQDNPTLLMRPADDNREDYLVKLQIFNEHIRYNYDVLCVFDDRKQVVDMWRSLGLRVNHVDKGEF